MNMDKTHVAITALGGFVPETVFTNDDIAKMVDTSDEWITTRVGIKERRILGDEGKGSSYLGIRAVKNLFETHPEVKPEDIDLVLASTNTPDYPFPSTASLIADGVGIPKGVPCFDFEAGCTGFIFGLQIVRGFVESGLYKKVLLVAAEDMSAIVDPEDRATLPLFGDGAACAILEPSTEGVGVQDIIIGNDNEEAAIHLVLKAGGSANPASHETVDRREHFVYQEGQYVFKNAVTYMGDVTEQILSQNGLTQEDIAWVVPHQANLRIIKATAQRINLSMDKVLINIEHFGNTSSASIPLCLWQNEARLKKGDVLILTAFGAGYTYGSAYLKWAY